MQLLVLTHSSQIDHLHSRNVPQPLFQYMSYNSSFYSDNSQECFAKMKLYVFKEAMVEIN